MAGAGIGGGGGGYRGVFIRGEGGLSGKGSTPFLWMPKLLKENKKCSR